MAQTIYQVDAFTDTPFAGNPAGVCLLEAAASEQWMQNIALEMNLSETAFLAPAADGYDLRWFTPSTEVDLCGHATLASAHTLWETGALPATQQARFHTRSGLLTADKHDDWISMDFPSDPPSPLSLFVDVGAALGTKPLSVSKGRRYYLVEVATEQEVRELKPEFGLWQESKTGCIVTSASDSKVFDFVSRFFALGLGIHEDPVTGSAHCVLAPYWAEKLGRTELVGYQASARGGTVRVRLDGDRVVLSGQAVTVMHAELRQGLL